jgi:hypothetical protein
MVELSNSRMVENSKDRTVVWSNSRLVVLSQEEQKQQRKHNPCQSELPASSSKGEFPARIHHGARYGNYY